MSSALARPCRDTRPVRRSARALSALLTLALLALLPLALPPARAELAAVGPIDPAHGFPVWYEDETGTRLALCLERDTGMCLEPPPADGTPSVPGNFPEEAFWWSAEAEMDTPAGGRALLVLAMEAAFANEAVEANQQVSFGRVRIRVDNLQVGGVYTVTHPYGTSTFVAEDDGDGTGVINMTEDIGCEGAPCDFTRALASSIGPFLRWTDDPALPAGYLGNPNVPHTVTGSPRGTNYFEITGPGFGAGLRTDLFSVQGKIYVAPQAPGLLLTPAGLRFPPGPVNVTSEPNVLTVTSAGTEPLSVTGVTIGGRNPGNFAVVSNGCAGAAIPPGGTCRITVTARPSALGAREAELRIATNAPGSPHRAALSAFGTRMTVGPVDEATGFPTWYGDATGLRLALCLDPGGLCLEPAPNAGDPAVPGNFPEEAFWWAAEAEMPTRGAGRARLVLAMEAAFANEVVAAGDQVTFGRIRVRADNLVAGGTYTVTHPYGRDTFVAEADQDGTGFINSTVDVGCLEVPCEFRDALASRIGPFLRWPSGAPAGHIGDRNVPHVVTGSPTGNNFFRITGPGLGTGGVRTDLFSVQGKVFTDETPPPPPPPPAPVPGAPSFSPSPVDFGSQPVNTTSPRRTITVTNPGPGDLIVRSVAISGANAADFTVDGTNTCTAGPVAANSSCTINVTFRPSAEGARNAALTLRDNAAGETHSVSLMGTGAAVATAATVSPTSIDFGEVPFGGASTTRTVTVRNTGTTPVVLGAVSRGGQNPNDFVVTSNNCGGRTLAVGGSCTVGVRFFPQTIGVRTAMLNIASNAPAPLQVSLRGTCVRQSVVVDVPLFFF